MDHCFVKISYVAHIKLLLLENASIGLPTNHIHTLYLQLEISRLASNVTGDYSIPSNLRFHLSKLSEERLEKDIYNAFDVRVKSRDLMSKAIVDPASLDRYLVSLV